MQNQQIVESVKNLIIEICELEDIEASDIADDEPLFGDGLGLDSIDALEIGVALHNQFGVTLDAESKDTKAHFASVNALAAFIGSQTQ